MKNILVLLSSSILFFNCNRGRTIDLRGTETEGSVKVIDTKTTKKEPKATLKNTGDYLVAGKEYIGAPTQEKSISGCEGCGERGSFEFSETEDKVSFIWSGSDIMDGGTYEQDGDKIKITSIYGETHVFRVSEDGKEIISEEYKTVFRDKRYPWKE